MFHSTEERLSERLKQTLRNFNIFFKNKQLSVIQTSPKKENIILPFSKYTSKRKLMKHKLKIISQPSPQKNSTSEESIKPKEIIEQQGNMFQIIKMKLNIPKSFFNNKELESKIFCKMVMSKKKMSHLFTHVNESNQEQGQEEKRYGENMVKNYYSKTARKPSKLQYVKQKKIFNVSEKKSSFSLNKEQQKEKLNEALSKPSNSQYIIKKVQPLFKTKSNNLMKQSLLLNQKQLTGWQIPQDDPLQDYSYLRQTKIYTKTHKK